jgi:glycosyltransferase involved in cell wall biosynthesis
MSVGCIPVVTRIPSFEEMTAGGQYGRLFDIGDDSALAESVVLLSSSGREALSQAVKDHFEEELSFSALARKLEDYYREALS